MSDLFDVLKRGEEPSLPAHRICLVGASGLIGTAVLDESVGRSDMRVVSVARREFPLPLGARTEVLVGLPDDWSAMIGAARADVLVCALGTTIKAAGSQAAFRAVDHDLVVEVAHAARTAGVDHMIAVSSAGADRSSRNFYLRTKGETEEDLGKLGFRRLDILRPGLLRGHRAEKRKLEGAGQLIAPFADMLVLHGKWRKYRSVRASTVARAIFALVQEKVQGRFVHDFDSMRQVLRRAGD